MRERPAGIIGDHEATVLVADGNTAHAFIDVRGVSRRISTSQAAVLRGRALAQGRLHPQAERRPRTVSTTNGANLVSKRIAVWLLRSQAANVSNGHPLKTAHDRPRAQPTVPRTVPSVVTDLECYCHSPRRRRGLYALTAEPQRRLDEMHVRSNGTTRRVVQMHAGAPDADYAPGNPRRDRQPMMRSTGRTVRALNHQRGGKGTPRPVSHTGERP